jgi:hypothetical protein
VIIIIPNFVCDKCDAKIFQYTIEEKVIERAYKKLALDALVIQQGRLAEQKSKGLILVIAVYESFFYSGGLFLSCLLFSCQQG